MAKTFRFLVTLPADKAPSPVAADIREEIHYLLRRSLDAVKVETIKTNERVIEFPKRKEKSL